MFDRNALMQQLERLSPRKRLLFGLSCTERMYPNYCYFKNMTNWGEPQYFRRTLDLLWADPVGGYDFERLKDKCAKWTPDIEDFDNVCVSYALDAASSVILLIEYIATNNMQCIADIASLSIDTVDMFIQEQENFGMVTPDIERQINEHPTNRPIHQ